YKAAIVTLERILIFNPLDLNAHILLMQINLLTGNDIDARRYAERILTLKHATDDQIREAEQVIAKLKAENQPFVFSGFLALGGGIDDNPEGGSKGNRALIGDSIATLDKQARAEEFMTTSLLLDMTYRLENQSRSQLQMRLHQNVRDYSHYNDGDLSSTGISTNLAHQLRSVRFGAALNANHIAINGSHLLDIYGSDVHITHNLANRLSGTLTTSISRRVYKDRQANATLQTGNNYLARYRITKAYDYAQIGSYISTEYTDATAPWERYTLHRIGADITTNILPGLTMIAASYAYRDHPHLHPAYGSTYRTDIRRDITLTHHIGLQHLTTPKPGETRLTTRASIRNESSSIANYHRNSGEVSMIITRYF
ncbi:MAG: hypothetical protein ACPHRC_09975, partial [Candidatus Puniceispirillales bacterium]